MTPPYRITKVWIEDERGDTFEVNADGSFTPINAHTGRWNGRIVPKWNAPEAVAFAIRDLFTTEQEASA
jgi:hypothetical protein